MLLYDNTILVEILLFLLVCLCSICNNSCLFCFLVWNYYYTYHYYYFITVLIILWMFFFLKNSLFPTLTINYCNSSCII